MAFMAILMGLGLLCYMLLGLGELQALAKMKAANLEPVVGRIAQATYLTTFRPYNGVVLLIGKILQDLMVLNSHDSKV